MLFRITMICLTAVTLLGCGSDSGLDLQPVKGKVLLDGQPLTEGNISFFPTGGSMSSGEINAQGEFELFSVGSENGALVGNHKVTVSPAFDPNSGSSPTEETEEAKQSGPAVRIPSKYQDITTTDLTAEVVAGENNLTIELSSS